MARVAVNATRRYVARPELIGSFSGLPAACRTEQVQRDEPALQFCVQYLVGRHLPAIDGNRELRLAARITHVRQILPSPSAD